MNETMREDLANLVKNRKERNLDAGVYLMTEVFYEPHFDTIHVAPKQSNITLADNRTHDQAILFGYVS